MFCWCFDCAYTHQEKKRRETSQWRGNGELHVHTPSLQVTSQYSFICSSLQFSSPFFFLHSFLIFPCFVLASAPVSCSLLNFFTNWSVRRAVMESQAWGLWGWAGIFSWAILIQAHQAVSTSWANSYRRGVMASVWKCCAKCSGMLLLSLCQSVLLWQLFKNVCHFLCLPVGFCVLVM